MGRSTYFSPRTYVRKVSEGVSEHSADKLPFLKGTSDFLTENKSIHTYYLRTLQRRLGVRVPLRNGKLSAECSVPPPTVRKPLPLPYVGWILAGWRYDTCLTVSVDSVMRCMRIHLFLPNSVGIECMMS